jgi:hypothetical protein
MAIRCYYWNTRKLPKLEFLYLKVKGKYTGMQLEYGNAGDIMNKDLIEFIYKEKALNIEKENNRLLLIGSIMNVVEQGDVIAGIGWKGNDDFSKFDVLNKTTIHGLRGPMTYEFLKKNGVNLGEVKFLLDPGLLIKQVYGLNIEKYNKPKGVIFIPHYREYGQYMNRKLPLGISLKRIDSKPKALAETILNSEFVITSSLHAIIFCHALNRPCLFVLPQTEEPLFKYQDYFASVNVEFTKPLNHIDDITAKDLLKSPVFINKNINDFYFPTKEELIKAKILVYNHF